jgi:hypothetical protein
VRSHADARSRVTAITFALLAILCVGIANYPRTALAQSAGDAITDTEIETAVDVLKADPNLSRDRKTRTLRWRDESKPEERKPGSFAAWIKDFFVWLGQLSRALVWVLGGFLALALVWIVTRLFINAKRPSRIDVPVVPTHVRDLDIRPESLPSDIGAAALSLWQQDQHRAALALLYRGLLSRLAHTHRVPIRDASTEGDCLALAAKHLPPERRDYVAQLIGVWQRATYGGRDPETDVVQELCNGFGAALAASAATQARGS